ncbi:MAG: O-antigen ligase family protein [Clostridia bacterium]|nr:O-antigen ligase family protein [Clostridia bacterium]
MLTELKNFFSGNRFVPLFLIVSIFAVGLFHNPAAFAAGAVLCIYLSVAVHKNGELRFVSGLPSISVALIAFSYFATIIWAVDSGVALFGFFRYLAVFLFMVVMMQKNAPSKDALFSVVAYSGAVMTLISVVLMHIEPVEQYFSVAGRLAGFWQYPNSFAMLLLCGMIVLLTKERIRVWDYVALAVLAFGMFYSGSRIALAVAFVSIFAVILFRRGKKVKIIIGAFVLIGVIAALVYVFASGNMYLITRFLSTSLTESTFVGRILYVADAMPLIIRYPFGMGYFGYYFTHTGVQTGVYELSFVHNDFLQLVLDIGWIPSLVFVAAIIKTFFRKGTSLRIRVLLFAICAHSFFDFDLQFIAMMMILVLCLDFDCGKVLILKKRRGISYAVAGVLCAVLVYFNIAQSAYLLGNTGLSYSMYRGDTLSAVHILINETDVDKSLELSESILRRNPYCTIAASVKARSSFSKGDLPTAMEYKNKVLEMSPFAYDEYKEYCQMLVYSIQLYTRAGDTYSADICKKELGNVVAKLEGLDDKVSKLGKMIKDQPKTQLTGEISVLVKEYLNK